MGARHGPAFSHSIAGRPARLTMSDLAPAATEPEVAAPALSFLRRGVQALTRPLSTQDGSEAARERWLAGASDAADFERRDRAWELQRQRRASLPIAL